MISKISGSIQSSNTGENEEYDSRGESISSFNLPPPHPSPSPTTVTTFQHERPSSSFIFDPLSPYLTSFPFPPPESNSLSLDPTWLKRIQPYSACTTLGAMTATRSSVSSSASPSSVQPPAQADRSSAAPRGAKKRSRASRRAPTTVLTTDTSNFRAMVQQFTGLPTPPFTSSHFPRPRLDLYNMGAAAIPPYLLRPSAQKIPSASFLPMTTTSTSSASLLDHAIASISGNTIVSINMPIRTTETSSPIGATPSSTEKCQLSLFGAQYPSTLDMQSANFISQPLLQSQTAPEYNSHSLGYAFGGLGSLLATEGMNLSHDTDVLSGWANESGQENAEPARSKTIIRNYGNPR
nr:PREDICTED: flocculation protein FLO11-like [Musa acuminata subsp. malaccensis]